jgi:hypothetical protein
LTASVDAPRAAPSVDARDDGSRAFALFGHLQAFSGLLDLASFDHWLASPFHAAWGAACVAVVLKPRALAAFAAMHALRIAAFAWDSPDTPNHQLLYAIASATVLCAWPLARRAKRARPAAGEWLERFAPALRLELCILYFFGVLHKLNRDYFATDVSCAVNTFIGVAPDWLDALATGSEASRSALIAGSLAAEAAVPLLLVFPRTRRFGIALGAAFHGFLGLRFYAFTTGLLALYALFVPGSLWGDAAARIARLRARGGIAAWLLSPTAAKVATLTIVAGFALSGAWVDAGARGAALARIGYPLSAAGWIVLAAVALVWLLGSRAFAAGFAGAAPGRLAATPALLVFPLLLLFHGFSPYLGLRTVPAFSMFSNLRTEGGMTNHWFMPGRALRVAGFQEDLVTLLSAEDAELLRFARRPRRTFYDFKLRIQRMAAAGKRAIAVSYRRGGEPTTLAAAERDPELMAPVPWWQRKWLRFRPVPIAERRECSW